MCHSEECDLDAWRPARSDARKRWIKGAPAKFCKAHAREAGLARGRIGDVQARTRAVEMWKTGRYSQRDIARELGVTQPSVWRYTEGVLRAAPDLSRELSAREAAAVAGVSKEIINDVLDAGLIPSHWGTRLAKNGRPGPSHLRLMWHQDLNRWLGGLSACLYPGCELLGVTASGCCGRQHVTALRMRDPHQLAIAANHFLEHTWKGGVFWSGRKLQVWKGRLAGPKGAADGAAKGGRPPISTPEQQQQMLELLNAGRPIREIALVVFGSERYKNRVHNFARR